MNDKTILNEVTIEKTYILDDWKLHDISINEEKIPELQRAIADGPWYIHVWDQAEKNIIVIFKDKTFKIDASDRSTWNEAIAHGENIGIPKEQLDFKIV